VPRPDARWVLAVHGSIVTGVFVGVGHKGDLDVAGFEGQHSSEGLGRVYVLKDGPWRCEDARESAEMCSLSLLWRCGASAVRTNIDHVVVRQLTP